MASFKRNLLLKSHRTFILFIIVLILHSNVTAREAFPYNIGLQKLARHLESILCLDQLCSFQASVNTISMLTEIGEELS